MFEHQFQPLLPRLWFIYRLLRSSLAGLAVVAASLLAGMLGYHHFERLNWIDSYLNASMILSGMGPLHSPITTSGKIFAGAYALYSGFVVILATGIVFAPVVHRFLHRFHIATQQQKNHHPSGSGDHHVKATATTPPSVSTSVQA